MKNKILLLFLFISLFGISQQQINKTMIHDGNANELIYSIYTMKLKIMVLIKILYYLVSMVGEELLVILSIQMTQFSNSRYSKIFSIYPQAAIDPDDP